MDHLIEFGPMVLGGLKVTILLALTSLVLATLFGLAGAALKLSRNRTLRMVGSAYTTLVRGIPDLVLMLLIFFGGQILINDLGKLTGLWRYVEIDPYTAGMFTLGFIFGAYMTETFRGAFLAIPAGQIEAAQSIGMSPRKYLVRIVWPQIVPRALPTFTNNWLVLLKTTALVSIIGLQDIVYNAYQAGRTTQEPFIFLMVSFCIYLVLTLISDFFLRKLGRVYALK